jgi:hypothetical protein
VTRLYAFDSAIRNLRSPRLDDNGFLHVDAEIARVGVMDYPDRVAHGEPRRRLVPAEALFDPVAMASMVGVPITDKHPPKLLGAADARHFQVGSVSGMPRQDGDFLIAPLTITDAELIRKVMAREQVELSPGYVAELLLQPGVWQGESYDAVQGPRIYNHAAVVPVGRCAGDCGGQACRCVIGLDARRASGATTMAKKIKVPHRDGSFVEMPLEMLKDLIAGMEPAKAIDYLLSLLGAGDDEVEEPEAPPASPPGMGPPRPPGMDTRPANIPALDAGSPLLARLAAQDAQLQAMRDQLAAQGTQLQRASAQGEVAAFTGRWLPFMDGFNGAELRGARQHLLKRLYPEQVAAIDAYPDAVLAARVDLAELDPMVQAVRSNAAHGGLAALGQLVHGDAGGEVDQLAAAEQRFNGKAPAKS